MFVLTTSPNNAEKKEGGNTAEANFSSRLILSSPNFLHALKQKNLEFYLRNHDLTKEANPEEIS